MYRTITLLVVCIALAAWTGQCPYCGHETVEADRYCSWCGSYLLKDEQGDREAVPASLMKDSIIRKIAVLPFIGRGAEQQKFSEGMRVSVENLLKKTVRNVQFVPAPKIRAALRKVRRSRTDLPYSSRELALIADMLDAGTLFSGCINNLSAKMSTFIDSVERVRKGHCLVRTNVEGLVFDAERGRVIFTKTEREKYFSESEEKQALDQARDSLASGLFGDFTRTNLELWRPGLKRE